MSVFIDLSADPGAWKEAMPFLRPGVVARDEYVHGRRKSGRNAPDCLSHTKIAAVHGVGVTDA